MARGRIMTVPCEGKFTSSRFFFRSQFLGRGCDEALFLRSARPATEAPKDLENSRKTAEKGAEWRSCKVPGKQPKNSRTGSQTAEKQLFCTLRVFFRLFFGCFAGTLVVIHEGLSAPFSAAFRLFSRSGVRGLCSWSSRS